MTTTPTNRMGAFVLSARRVTFVVGCVIGAVVMIFVLWRPGLKVQDGRNDRGSNAVWIAHGWLGADDWFLKNNKTNEFEKYRAPASLNALAVKLRKHGIKDLFPHLCPAEITGHIPPVDHEQVERFLDVFADFRVLPWIGGPNGSSARLNNSQWRETFITDISLLLAKHPRFAGVHLNVEPLTSGDKDFLQLLDEIRKGMPAGKLLSVAAYPPPTWWHPFPDVHWDESYFRQVAKRCDHIAVMMYDVGQKIPKTYQRLMADWTVEVLDWSEGKPVLLGVPTYEDADVEYHNPKVENLENALLGIHRGLSRKTPPCNYQGVAIYCDWEISEGEWDYLRGRFLK